MYPPPYPQPPKPRMWGGFETPEPSPAGDPYLDRSSDMLDDLGVEGPQRLGAARSLLTINQGLRAFRPRTRSEILLGIEPREFPAPGATADVYQEEKRRLRPTQAAALNQASGTTDYQAGMDSELLDALGGASKDRRALEDRATERAWQTEQNQQNRATTLEAARIRDMNGSAASELVPQAEIDALRKQTGLELPDVLTRGGLSALLRGAETSRKTTQGDRSLGLRERGQEITLGNQEIRKFVESRLPPDQFKEAATRQQLLNTIDWFRSQRERIDPIIGPLMGRVTELRRKLGFGDAADAQLVAALRENVGNDLMAKTGAQRSQSEIDFFSAVLAQAKDNPEAFWALLDLQELENMRALRSKASTYEGFYDTTPFLRAAGDTGGGAPPALAPTAPAHGSQAPSFGTLPTPRAASATRAGPTRVKLPDGRHLTIPPEGWSDFYQKFKARWAQLEPEEVR